MKNDPFEEYKLHAHRYAKLMQVDANKIENKVAFGEWRLCCFEEKSAMQKLEKRLTYHQKHQLGILPSQRKGI